MPAVASKPVVCSTPAKTKTNKLGKEVVVYQQMSSINSQAFAWITHYLKTNQDKILLCKAHLEEGGWGQSVSASALEVAKKAPKFHDTYQTFDRLPLYWITDFFVSRLGMSKELVDKIDAVKGHQSREMLEYFTGVAGSSPWWACLKDKAVLADYLEWCVASLKNRHKDFDKHVAEGGKIDWSSANPFKFEWDKSKEPHVLTRILPCVGPALQPKRFIVDATFTCMLAWSDLRAKFSSDEEEDHQLCIAKMFPKDAPFKKIFDSDARLAKAKEFAEKRRVTEQQLAIGEQEVCTTGKKRKAEALKAQLALKTPPSKMKTPLKVD